MGWGGEEMLRRQMSCSCAGAALNMCGWHLGSRGPARRRGGGGGGRYSDEDDDEVAPLELKTRRGLRTRWRGIWRRIVRGRAAAPPSYDEFSYADNFDDQGPSGWTAEPEFLSRSFSAVYANPSGSLSRFDH